MPRVKGLKGFTEKLSENDMAELQRRMGEEKVRSLYVGYAVLGDTLFSTLDAMVKELVNELLQRAETEGVKVKASEHKGFFPYFYTYENGRWNLIKQEGHLEGFLRRFLDSDKILRLLSLANMRNDVNILFFHIHRLLVSLGIVED